MFSAQRTQANTRAVYLRGTIECQKCKSAIHVYKTNAIADEYSVQCRRCGHRGVYLKRFLHIEELPERRKKPRH